MRNKFSASDDDDDNNTNKMLRIQWFIWHKNELKKMSTMNMIQIGINMKVVRCVADFSCLN